jgi:hypothetical protein
LTRETPPLGGGPRPSQADERVSDRSD